MSLTIFTSLLFSIILSTKVYAQGELVLHLENLSNMKDGPKVDHKSGCTPSDYQACAKALCGDVKKHENVMNGVSLDQYNEAKFGKISDIEQSIRKILDERKQFYFNLLSGAKKNPLLVLSLWAPKEWDQKSIDAFAPDLKVNYKVENDELIVVPKDNVTDPEYKAVLIEFAEKYKVYLRKNPTHLYTQKLISIDHTVLLSKNLHAINYSVGSLCSSDICKNKLAKKVSSPIIQNIEKFITFNNDEKILKDKLAECLSNYIKNAIETEKVEEFKKLLPSVKERFISKGMSGFSEHSRQAFRNYLENNVKFDLDIGSPASPIENLKASQKMDTAGKDLELYPRLLDTKHGFNDFKSKEETIPVCSTTNDLSFQNSFSPPDSNLGKSNLVFSVRSCRHQKAGERIVAHELGHVLSYMVGKSAISASSMESYYKQRTCVKGWNPNQENFPYYSLHPKEVKEARYTEEDMADFLSYKTFKGSSEMGGCISLTTEGDKFSQLIKDPIFQSTPIYFRHTLPFVRLLREAIYVLDDIPKSCHPVIQEYREIYKDRTLCQ